MVLESLIWAYSGILEVLLPCYQPSMECIIFVAATNQALGMESMIISHNHVIHYGYGMGVEYLWLCTVGCIRLNKMQPLNLFLVLWKYSFNLEIMSLPTPWLIMLFLLGVIHSH